jgi:hypothetical protein
MTDIGAEFRALHDGTAPFVIPNPWDIGSARILAGMGFKALATTSAGLAFSLGLPEGTVPREVVLAHCRDLAAATPLPVSADLEKGFGDTSGKLRGDDPRGGGNWIGGLFDRGSYWRSQIAPIDVRRSRWNASRRRWRRGMRWRATSS